MPCRATAPALGSPPGRATARKARSWRTEGWREAGRSIRESFQHISSNHFRLSGRLRTMPRMPALEAFLHALPKVELHCHLFGTVRKDTFLDLNRRAGGPRTEEEITAFYTRGEKPVGVLRVLRALDAQLVRAPQDLYRMALEYLLDAAGHNVRHAEFSWNPTGTVHVSRIPYAPAQEALVRA